MKITRFLNAAALGTILFATELVTSVIGQTPEQKEDTTKSEDMERRRIAASIRETVPDIAAPNMEMLMLALDISTEHAPYERCIISKEGLLINIKGNGLQCSYSPFTLVDKSPGRAYDIYWVFKVCDDGKVLIHGDDGKALRRFGTGEVWMPMESNLQNFDVETDDIRILKAVQRLTELYRQNFPRNN